MAVNQEIRETNLRRFLRLFCCGFRESNRVQSVSLNQAEKSSISRSHSILPIPMKKRKTRSIRDSMPDSSTLRCKSTTSLDGPVQEPCDQTEKDFPSTSSKKASKISSRSWRHSQAGWLENEPSANVVPLHSVGLESSLNQEIFNAILPKRRNAICEELEDAIYCNGVRLPVLREELMFAIDAMTYS